MGLITVEGTYRDGKVELDETPGFAEDDTRVLVTFTPVQSNRDAARQLALERLLAGMEAGFRLGGTPFPTREEIYDERITRNR